jgi:rhodanese-related sulfurtransferase
VTYAGDIGPTAAFEMLRAEESAVLVDVRTRAEWNYVGVPDVSSIGRPLLLVEWLGFPDGRPNPGFLQTLRDAGVSPGQPLLFLCRSGQRSIAAATAATAAGLGPAYNIAEGFEGNPDASGHRGTVGGWKVRGLPWRQT